MYLRSSDGLFDLPTFNVVSNIPTVCSTKMCVSYFRTVIYTQLNVVYAYLSSHPLLHRLHYSFRVLFLHFFSFAHRPKACSCVCIAPKQHQIKNGARVIVGGSKNPWRSAPDGRMGNKIVILVGFILYFIRRTDDQHRELYISTATHNAHKHIFYNNILYR